MPGGYEEDRARRLLLTGAELKELAGALQDKKQLLIPLSAHLKHGFIKLELGLGRIRKKSDKREVLKKRSHDREMRGAGPSPGRRALNGRLLLYLGPETFPERFSSR